MIVTYNDCVYCANIDWLQFSVHLKSSEPEIICPDGYHIELVQGNNIFEYRALVFDGKGEKVLTLLWKPYSAVLPSNLMTAQVNNSYLYMHGFGIEWAWKVLSEMVECTFNAIGRLDLCIDFQGNERITQFISHLNSNHYYVAGKHEGSAWWHDTTDGKKQLHCLTWGSQKTEIKVKVYHKSREQGVMDGNADNASKPYIIHEWQKAGFDIRNVWRLEFSLTGCGQLRWAGKPITLQALCDEQWLLQVLCELYTNRFITRINQGRRKGHKNEDARVYMIDLPARASNLKWQDAKLEKTPSPAAVKLLRSLMKEVDNPAVMTSSRVFDYYADTITRVINDYSLEGYFKRVWQTSSLEYLSELATAAGTGIHAAPASPSMLME